MPMAITNEQREQWSSVHKQALVLAEFFDIKASAFRTDHSLNWASAIRAAAEPAHPFARRFAGLRELLADLLENASYLSPADLRELDAHVRSHLGVGFDDLQVKRLARIATILAKGEITNDEQFRLLKGRHEEIWDDSLRAAEALSLNALLEEYESRKQHR
jgi:hypothetical protein